MKIICKLYTYNIYNLAIFECINFYILYSLSIYTMHCACNLKFITLLYCVVKFNLLVFIINKKKIDILLWTDIVSMFKNIGIFHSC